MAHVKVTSKDFLDSLNSSTLRLLCLSVVTNFRLAADDYGSFSHLRYRRRMGSGISSTSAPQLSRSDDHSDRQNTGGTMDKDSSKPTLSPAEFHIYNKFAVQMNYFHDQFRRTWDELQKMSKKDQPSQSEARAMIRMGLQFCSELHMHHRFEERHIYPVLSRRMLDFQPHHSLSKQHEKIDAGADQMQRYLEQCASGKQAFSTTEIRKIMGNFGSTLWSHLDDEVKALGAENMSKYWSLDEFRSLNL
ncbi:conserved hypothetical protein [Talaromyces stipitatus ATCC 10500]|uniref:Hemerythrin-like domain-containing protein n=1 Tax=Talaromyces stipitatus (strain ATCC 10500 / CBS 375.48 / QM 6759 / NRRL 1006) TaxID=441959 RepID=B8LXD0_TALSN|nr:uncharacterized protein TSTA_066580 [Talaromyces stipitatus ATCC 10500]XP_002340599.1 uncharacterized protein TSTA_066580 [Talaromyces stipitatus ATCC 10500]EED23211.1 conserved hypothetical protein [Talaromyces stipitatus ATCC 10500]EED23212.1 conserved hypothetical protein [Talaromyces stipitatus ATCC 10500]